MCRISAQYRGSAAGRSTAGFTLVEVLVVLVIAALVSGILLTGFERVLDIRLRLTSFLDAVEGPTLVADWFRASVAGLVPDVRSGHGRFAGNGRRMSGLSLAPLNAAAAVPTAITWEVTFDPTAGRTYLRYRNGGGSEMTIASWPGDYGRLSYCSRDFICQPSWPPNDRSSQLPALVRLDIMKGDDPWPVLAAPQADRDPYPPEQR
jgi:prepilin-type N-terminal cleavage/methylation domain-containing protein